MRIHTKLHMSEIYDVAARCGAPVSLRNLTEHGSRTHAFAFEVRLEGTGGRNNTGLYGAGDYDGATWDEWGAFFGALFDADPTARCGGTAKRPVYADAEHYHFLTGDRFHKRDVQRRGTLDEWSTSYLPADTHPRHRWVYDGAWGDHGASSYHCGKDGCTATKPRWDAQQAYFAEHKIGA